MLPTLDGYFYGLILNKQDVPGISNSGFHGGYSYFASVEFSFGSSPQNWPYICTELKSSGLSCELSVGPGYNDVKIRPWNSVNTKERLDGGYLKDMWTRATDAKADAISITSYNEWGEGTQIEPSIEYGTKYLDIVREMTKSSDNDEL